MVTGLSAIEFHDRTKHSPRSIREGGHRLDFDNKPRPYKIYESLPRRPLAETIRPSPLPALTAIAEDLPPGHGVSDLDLDALTQCCYYSAGITRRIRRRERELLFRAAACTGALYHIDLYLVTAGIDSLDAGVYHFDPMSMAVDVVRKGDYRARLADATGDHSHVARAPCSMIATSTWWRNAWKYQARTYRHAFWDAGTVIANLLAVAASLDHPASVVTGFADEPVARLVGVEPDHEAPIAIVPIGADCPSPDAPAITKLDPDTRPLSDHEVDYPLITEAYTASILRDGDAVTDWRTRWPETGVGTRSAGDGATIPLEPVPPEQASKVPLYRAIARRGSCREYTREPLNVRKVSTILDRAFHGVPLDDRQSVERLQFNDAYCLINGLEGVDPGAYQLHPEAGRLERLHAGDYRNEAGHLALDQRLGADAALSIYFMTDLDAVTDQLGNRSYRVAQLEAAITAGRLYLGASAHRDLGATGLTFYDDAVTDFFSPRAAGQTPTFLWTLGRPA